MRLHSVSAASSVYSELGFTGCSSSKTFVVGFREIFVGHVLGLLDRGVPARTGGPVGLLDNLVLPCSDTSGCGCDVPRVTQKSYISPETNPRPPAKKAQLFRLEAPGSPSFGHLARMSSSCFSWLTFDILDDLVDVL